MEVCHTKYSHLLSHTIFSVKITLALEVGSTNHPFTPPFHTTLSHHPSHYSFTLLFYTTLSHNTNVLGQYHTVCGCNIKMYTMGKQHAAKCQQTILEATKDTGNHRKNMETKKRSEVTRHSINKSSKNNYEN